MKNKMKDAEAFLFQRIQNDQHDKPGKGPEASDIVLSDDDTTFILSRNN